ncbi:MHO_1580 family protein [Mycoplasmopsis primatum]|uniref:MHO_1580 family protein n=1 Tax=Mycoplasmopsis primatum TaxID=55604 RepID=UPI000495ADCE|nr:hypothetical protein [Mycoplasmopsis primatum]
MNNLKRGVIEIRRFFNSNKFILRFWRASLTLRKPYKDEYCRFVLTVNNKVVEQNEHNRQQVTTTTSRIEKYINNYYTFDGIPRTSYNYQGLVLLQSMVVSSETLGITFDELKSITVTFESEHYPNPPKFDFWEVKKENQDNKNQTLNINDDYANIKIPEYYKFSFDEQGNSKTKIGYFNTKIKINPLKQDKRIHSIGTIHSESHSINNEELYTNNELPETYHDARLGPELFNKEAFYEHMRNAKAIFTRNQSLGEIKIQSIHSDAFKNISSDLTTETQKSIYVDGKDIKEVKYNNYVEFDYKKGELVQSLSGSERGLIVPYNFHGDLRTTYEFNFSFGQGTSGRDNKTIKVFINKNQHIKKPLIDVYSGLLKLKVKTLLPDSDTKFRYLFTPKQIKEIIQTNKTPGIEIFERYINE